jgi:hypothetical protein
MKKTIRLTESKLISIIKRIIKEQEDVPKLIELMKSIDDTNPLAFNAKVTYGGRTRFATGMATDKTSYGKCLESFGWQGPGISGGFDPTKPQEFKLVEGCSFIITIDGKAFTCTKNGCVAKTT